MQWALNMYKHFLENWWIYWGVLASAAHLYYRYVKSDATQPRAKRIRSLMAGSQYSDPNSKSYDPGLLVRMMLLVVIGIPLIGLAHFIVWLVGR